MMLHNAASMVTTNAGIISVSLISYSNLHLKDIFVLCLPVLHM